MVKPEQESGKLPGYVLKTERLYLQNVEIINIPYIETLFKWIFRQKPRNFASNDKYTQNKI